MYEFIHRIADQQGTSDPDPEPRQHYEVRCGRCGWWGRRKDLCLIDIRARLSCPMCLSDQWLEYKEED